MASQLLNSLSDACRMHRHVVYNKDLNDGHGGFERAGKRWVTCWHTGGEGSAFLPLPAGSFTYSDALGSEAIPPQISEEGVVLPMGKRRYLCTTLTKEELLAAFAGVKLL